MTEQYEQPLVSIDVVPVRFSEGQLRVGLGLRAYEPFRGQWALPGVLLGTRETIREASFRALRTKLALPDFAVREFFQVGAFDNPDRDPRGATLAIASVAVISPLLATEEVTWLDVPLSADQILPFDHVNMIRTALNETRLRLWRDREVTRTLLGGSFTTADAVRLSEALGETDVDRTNFNRMLKNYGGLETTGTAQTGRGRPTNTWRFTA